MMPEDTNPSDSFPEFLEDLARGRATIPQWNQHVVGRKGDPRWERYRQVLAQQGLTLGQCAGIPFPPALQQLARQLRDELQDE